MLYVRISLLHSEMQFDVRCQIYLDAVFFCVGDIVNIFPFFQVHDFGFFRYDPDAIQFLSYEDIPLAPEAACVGLEIRVVGNDSGEKVYIHTNYNRYCGC